MLITLDLEGTFLDTVQLISTFRGIINYPDNGKMRMYECSIRNTVLINYCNTFSSDLKWVDDISAIGQRTRNKEMELSSTQMDRNMKVNASNLL